MQSPTELQQRLRKAAEILEQAGLPEDLRPVAFTHLLDALEVSVAPTLANGNSHPVTAASANASIDPRHSSGQLLGKIAAALGQESEVIARFYEEDDGQVRLVVKRSMLLEPDKKAASIRHTALLVVAGRQAAGIEEYTSYDTIREECRELKVFDPANFAAEVGKLEFRTTGGRNSREARANRHHYDEAADLIRRMTEAAGR
jgi:hypothetical protein